MKEKWKKMNGLCGFLFACIIIGGCSHSKSVWIEEVREETTAEAVVEEQAEATEESVTIFVDVCGAVVSPGVYQLPAGSRTYQAITAAGGFLESAAAEQINQAEQLADGQQVRVYTKEELQKAPLLSEVEGTSDGKVNINLADKDTLMTLPGVGETRAEAILNYRESNGGFQSIDELQSVEGIKEKTYEKLKDKITVS